MRAADASSQLPALLSSEQVIVHTYTDLYVTVTVDMLDASQHTWSGLISDLAKLLVH